MRRNASEVDDDNEAFLEETVMGEDDDFEDEMFFPNSSTDVVTTTSKDGVILTSKDGVTVTSNRIPTIVVDDSQWETIETVVINGQVFVSNYFLNLKSR